MVDLDAPIAREGECTIEVAFSGICRTDLLVASRDITSRDPITLGHELSGVVRSSNDPSVRSGARVTVHPVIRCARCDECLRDAPCSSPAMLGVDRDGSFAERVRVPATNVFAIPESLSLFVAAYTEPVAAALAVVDVAGKHLDREAPGLIYGQNRIAELTRRILVAHGFSRLTLHDHRGPPLPRDTFSFAIETVATTETIRDLVSTLRPRGALILKSRTPSAIEIDLPSLVRKELSLHAVNYGSFARSIDLLATRRIVVDDLLGDRFSLADHEQAFARARSSEHAKVMFCMSSER